MGEFTKYLDPTPNTIRIAGEVEKVATTELEALQIVTKAFNKNIVYKPDQWHWGTVEQFSEPDVTLTEGSGDCEDMAFGICATMNSMTVYKPSQCYVTVGYYKPILGVAPCYHAWSFVDNYIADGTTGGVYHYRDARNYIPLLGIYPNKLVIFKDIGETI